MEFEGGGGRGGGWGWGLQIEGDHIQILLDSPFYEVHQLFVDPSPLSQAST